MASGVITKFIPATNEVFTGDLNDLTSGGFYSINLGSVTNAPTGLAGNCNIMIISGDVIHQVIFYASASIWVRRKSGSSLWGAWAHVNLS